MLAGRIGIRLGSLIWSSCEVVGWSVVVCCTCSVYSRAGGYIVNTSALRRPAASAASTTPTVPTTPITPHQNPIPFLQKPPPQPTPPPPKTPRLPTTASAPPTQPSPPPPAPPPPKLAACRAGRGPRAPAPGFAAAMGVRWFVGRIRGGSRGSGRLGCRFGRSWGRGLLRQGRGGPRCRASSTH